MELKKNIRKFWAKFQALPTRKKILYVSLFLVFQAIGIAVIIGGKVLEKHLEPLAQKMDSLPASWLILGALIAIVSIPPLFGHEILALVCGYVYGALYGFLILTISSIVGESFVYFGFRYWFSGALERFREKHGKNYGIFVAVVEDGGILMLWFIRMSVIPPHFSTPLFSSLRTITWWKWMIANILASPVKFFPPVYIGTLLRNKSNNSIIGDVVFAVSTLVTISVLWYIIRAYKAKKKQAKEKILAQEARAKVVDEDVYAREVEVGDVERVSGIEMTAMDAGKTRDDGRFVTPWPDALNQPSKTHLEHGWSPV